MEGNNLSNGFEELMIQLQQNSLDSFNSATPKELRTKVEELMIEIRRNEYFVALRSLLDNEKQKHGNICQQLANSMEIIIIQSHGANIKFNQENIENSITKIIPSVEQKMAECQAFCLSEQSTNCDTEESQLKLKMREIIEESSNIEKLKENNSNNCIQLGRQLLLQHSEFRPITFTDINLFESTIRLSTQIWHCDVRDAVCSHLLLLRALNGGKRKKRQNFSDKITCILNNYFINHLSKPYPDETTKLELAEQCGITLAQVSNWFGNKRIRYRKAQIKALKATKETNKEDNK